jgi:hypothetical protein
VHFLTSSDHESSVITLFLRRDSIRRSCAKLWHSPNMHHFPTVLEKALIMRIKQSHGFPQSCNGNRRHFAFSLLYSIQDVRAGSAAPVPDRGAPRPPQLTRGLLEITAGRDRRWPRRGRIRCADSHTGQPPFTVRIKDIRGLMDDWAFRWMRWVELDGEYA